MMHEGSRLVAAAGRAGRDRSPGRPGRQAQTPAPPRPKYDLLLKGGHVIDARNSIDAVRDVAIAAARSRWSRRSIPPADAGKTIDVVGPLRHARPDRHPRPRLHRHRRARTPTPATTASIRTASRFRVGVTTVVDAGGSGWRNFEDFKTRDHRSRRRPASSPSSTSSATACAAASSRATQADMECAGRPRRWR